MGATRLDVNDGPTQLTLRAEYERRVHEWYGIGGLVEASFDEPRTAVIAVAFTLHPVSTLRVTMAAGGDHEAGSWAFLYRIGADYAFVIRPGWSIGPAAALDFGRGRRTLLLGASVARTF